MDFNWFFNEVFNVYLKKKDKINSTFIYATVCIKNEEWRAYNVEYLLKIWIEAEK